VEKLCQLLTDVKEGNSTIVDFRQSCTVAKAVMRLDGIVYDYTNKLLHQAGKEEMESVEKMYRLMPALQDSVWRDGWIKDLKKKLQKDEASPTLYADIEVEVQKMIKAPRAEPIVRPLFL
jgi:hypothetical protein